MPTDTERMDFLEALRNKVVFVTKENPDYYTDTDIHISGINGCGIYVRNSIGHALYRSHGASVREAIDDVIYIIDNK